MIPYHVIDERAYEPVVLWDGTKGGPGGRYLAAKEEAPQATPARVERRPALTAEIVRCLRGTGPMTVGEITKALSAGRESVQTRLSALQARGIVVTVGERPRVGGWGRQIVHLYALLHDPRTRRADGGA